MRCAQGLALGVLPDRARRGKLVTLVVALVVHVPAEGIGRAVGLGARQYLPFGRVVTKKADPGAKGKNAGFNRHGRAAGWGSQCLDQVVAVPALDANHGLQVTLAPGAAFHGRGQRLAGERHGGHLRARKNQSGPDGIRNIPAGRGRRGWRHRVGQRLHINAQPLQDGLCSHRDRAQHQLGQHAVFFGREQQQIARRKANRRFGEIDPADLDGIDGTLHRQFRVQAQQSAAQEALVQPGRVRWKAAGRAQQHQRLARLDGAIA